jgi:hypothetical protein
MPGFLSAKLLTRLSPSPTSDAVSANGDHTNVRMMLPSFIHMHDPTRVQLSDPCRRR